VPQKRIGSALAAARARPVVRMAVLSMLKVYWGR